MPVRNSLYLFTNLQFSMISFLTLLWTILLSPVVNGTAINTKRDATNVNAGLASCLVSSEVNFSVQSDVQFPDLNEPFNLRLNYTPAAIVVPTTPEQISSAVKCAASAGVHVQARGGGHSYASYSSGGQNESLVINLELFQDISVDPDTMVARVGGGVRLGNLALGLYEYGGLKRAVPHGTCPGVGIGGHFTHGGYGYDSRMWGLALDTIVALDAVLANGSVIHATNTSYPDVYFTMRGAADCFGIVTTFYLQTQPAPENITVFQIPVPAAFQSAEMATSSFLHLQNFSTNPGLIDRRLTFGVYIDNAFTFNIGGMFFGSLSEFQSTQYENMMDTLPAPESPDIQSMAWLDALQLWAGSDPLSQPLTGYDEHDTFYAKSIVTQESKPLTQTALQNYFSFILSQGKSVSGWFSIINLYGGPDSAINALPTTFAAYSHRSSLWVFQHYVSHPLTVSEPTFPQSSLTFINNLNSALESAQPDGDFDAYLNYVDPTLSAEDAHRLYYGEQLTTELEGIKSQVDPGNVFWNPQGILPAGNSGDK